MKKIIAIFFLSIYFLSTTQLSQFLKVPLLVKHYVEHKEDTPNMSLVDFLVMHYQQPNSHSHSKESHQSHKLPFVNFSNVLVLMCISPQAIQFDLQKKFLISQKKCKITFYNQFAESAYLSAIWQPPRTC